jgi:hypothetical protein
LDGALSGFEVLADTDADWALSPALLYALTL